MPPHAACSAPAGPPTGRDGLCWSTVAGLGVIHLGGVAGIVWIFVHPSLATIVAAAVAYAETPRPGAVYNIGGGRANSVSILEAIARFEELFATTLEAELVDEPRRGDHICYISDLRRLKTDYPEWDVRVSLDDIFDDFAPDNGS